MIADGFFALISAAEIEDGTISEKTWASRTRRAINWAYWAPKSTTRTPRSLGTVNKYLYTLKLFDIGVATRGHCPAQSTKEIHGSI